MEFDFDHSAAEQKLFIYSDDELDGDAFLLKGFLHVALVDKLVWRWDNVVFAGCD